MKPHPSVFHEALAAVGVGDASRAVFVGDRPYDDIYGFHDSAWQTIPYGSTKYHTDGSHGCVHLPIAAMKWLYNWAAVGAAVTIR